MSIYNNTGDTIDKSHIGLRLLNDLFSYLLVHLKERDKKTEGRGKRERKGEKESVIFHLLAYSPQNVYNSWALPGGSQEPKTPSRSSTGTAGTQVLEPSRVTLHDDHYRNLEGKWSSKDRN